MNLNAIGIIFSNMHDEEMHEITGSRTMGALPFGGKYRLVDFALSNMRNSSVASVGIVAKSNYQSLLEHLGSGKEWDLARKREGLFLFPPYGRSSAGIYKNKIEALNGIMTYIDRSRYDYVIITDCDTICNMDWEEPLSFHITQGADITVISYKLKAEEERKKETVYSLSPEGLVTDMKISQTAKESDIIGTNMWITGKQFLVSMIQEAMAYSLTDIEKDIFQKNLCRYKIAAWEYNGFLRKINSLNDYFKANMDILEPEARKVLFYNHGPVYTKVMDEIPVRYGHKAKVSHSLIADGCLIEGQVENSILFSAVTVEKGAVVKDSILMKGTYVGENAILQYVLSDKAVTFSNGRMLVGCEQQPIYVNKGSKL
ncbi:glucose-1-phosphate adenylyltransferase subunit GlgD [Anaerocolumna xylanovorans]|uniref:Glucose-1-phosphate adenylyltransferase n=1 Tax=Anaerocolumna xylanovorans DSM 12503 TaxID=1121345 RepID=A0A1M7YNQ5_9FIRM|nr:glucose-1-phosphate adenylyltransferase subunit GlgD [Anaerocolumna xylanovorans]SHO54227.1 glucose-1-phosphate adenylyltransferase [Anaerocolumna xylanovorans DSM 12503]